VYLLEHLLADLQLQLAGLPKEQLAEFPQATNKDSTSADQHTGCRS
jgi:hypothetical protein